MSNGYQLPGDDDGQDIGNEYGDNYQYKDNYKQNLNDDQLQQDNQPMADDASPFDQADGPVKNSEHGDEDGP